MPFLTSRSVEVHKPKDKPYRITIDRGMQLRIAPDGCRTVLVRYTVRGTKDERQYTLPQEYGDTPAQITLADACAEGQRIRTLARAGIDWPAEEAARLRAEEAGYLALIEPGRVGKNGRKFVDGVTHGGGTIQMYSLGSIDAGEAGIRAGHINVAALHVVNADNIQVQGESTGIPTMVAVNVGALTSASAASASAATAASETVSRARNDARQNQPSIFSVQILGFVGEPEVGLICG